MADFYGAYGVVVEKAGRMRLPGDTSDAFRDAAYMCKWPGPCVKIYPPKEWDEYISILKDLGKRRDKATEWEVRTVFGSREKVSVKGKGRLTIPQELRDYANLKGGEKILVIGAMDHLELWASDDAYNAAMDRAEWQG